MAIARVTTHQSADHWLVLATASLASFVVTMNSTAVITALPQIKTDLDLSHLTEQWVINIYILVAAVLVAVMGRLSDLFGKMNVFILGLVTFGAGSLAIIAAQDVVTLMFGRICQGIGAAALVTASAALVSIATPKPQLAFALGIWSGLFAFGLGIGPLVGGILTDTFNWRAVFVVDVILLLIAAALCLRIARHHLVSEVCRKCEHVDYLGGILLIVGLAPLVYGLSAGHKIGWTSGPMLVLLVASLGGLATFAFRERRAVEPLVHFHFFRRPRYLAATSGCFIDGPVAVGVLYFFNLFSQSLGGLELTAFLAGAAMIPYTGTSFVLSILLPRWLGKSSLRWPIVLGMLSMALGFWLLSFTTAQSTYHDLWWKLVFVGVGMGLTYPLLRLVGSRALPDEHCGQGSGVITMFYYVGVSVGIAVGASLLAELRRNEVDTVVRSLEHAPEHASSLVWKLAHGAPSVIKATLAKFRPDDVARIEHTLHTTDASAFASVMVLFMILALIGAGLCFWLIRPGPDEAAEAGAS